MHVQLSWVTRVTCVLLAANSCVLLPAPNWPPSITFPVNFSFSSALFRIISSTEFLPTNRITRTDLQINNISKFTRHIRRTVTSPQYKSNVCMCVCVRVRVRVCVCVCDKIIINTITNITPHTHTIQMSQIKLKVESGFIKAILCILIYMWGDYRYEENLSIYVCIQI